MASKRMFSMKIVDTDAFLDMPATAQNLYFHLNMRADDDGFIDKVKRIMRDVRATEDDLKILIAKSFIIEFDGGVFVIKHWFIHNTLQKDRYHETTYLEEKSMLSIKENKAYTLWNNGVNTKCIQNGNRMETECFQNGNADIDIDLDIDKDITNIVSKDTIHSNPTDMQRVIDAWNELGLSKVNRIVEGTNRYKWLKKRIKDYGIDDVLKAIENVKFSNFLQNANFFSFDWMIRPNNFPKVLEGNYTDVETVKKEEYAAKEKGGRQ